MSNWNPSSPYMPGRIDRTKKSHPARPPYLFRRLCSPVTLIPRSYVERIKGCPDAWIQQGGLTPNLSKSFQPSPAMPSSNILPHPLPLPSSIHVSFLDSSPRPSNHRPQTPPHTQLPARSHAGMFYSVGHTPHPQCVRQNVGVVLHIGLLICTQLMDS